MAVASGKRDPSGRDLVFEQWYADNIEAVAGGRVEQRAIFKEYRKTVAPGIALGEQGVERMLNRLRVKRKVQAGKPYRLGVGFKRQAANIPLGAGHLPQAVKLPPVRVEMLDTVKPDAMQAAPSVTAQSAAPPPPAAPVEDVRGRRVGVVQLFNAVTLEDVASADAAIDVFKERLRQRRPTSEGGEGYDAAHDDASDPGAHERAAACYAYASAQPEHVVPFVDFNRKSGAVGRVGYIVRDSIVMMWPWAAAWWKPKTEAPDWKRRCMVIAGALIVAAIERYDRDKARQALADSQASQMTGV